MSSILYTYFYQIVDLFYVKIIMGLKGEQKMTDEEILRSQTYDRVMNMIITDQKNNKEALQKAEKSLIKIIKTLLNKLETQKDLVKSSHKKLLSDVLGSEKDEIYSFSNLHGKIKAIKTELENYNLNFKTEEERAVFLKELKKGFSALKNYEKKLFNATYM